MAQHSRLTNVAILALVIGNLAGCSTSRVEVARHTETTLGSNEAIVILARRTTTGRQIEETFMHCLTRALSRDTALNLYPERDFIDRLFPWFEPRTAPTTLDELPRLLDRPGVLEEISELGIRYLVWVDGTTEKGDGGGGLTCTVAPTGGGCLGFVWWEKESAYEASIWDLKSRGSVGQVSAEVSGTSYLPAFIVPIPLIARTQTTACKGLADQLAELLVVGPASH